MNASQPPLFLHQNLVSSPLGFHTLLQWTLIMITTNTNFLCPSILCSLDVVMPSLIQYSRFTNLVKTETAMLVSESGLRKGTKVIEEQLRV